MSQILRIALQGYQRDLLTNGNFLLTEPKHQAHSRYPSLFCFPLALGLQTGVTSAKENLGQTGRRHQTELLFMGPFLPCFSPSAPAITGFYSPHLSDKQRAPFYVSEADYLFGRFLFLSIYVCLPKALAKFDHGTVNDEGHGRVLLLVLVKEQQSAPGSGSAGRCEGVPGSPPRGPSRRRRAATHLPHFFRNCRSMPSGLWGRTELGPGRSRGGEAPVPGGTLAGSPGVPGRVPPPQEDALLLLGVAELVGVLGGVHHPGAVPRPQRQLLQLAV